MAKYCGADCRICRREGCKLFLKGARCISSKCPFDRKNGTTIPGQHGANQKRRPRLSGYGLQLREKQKVKKAYGLLEKQFKKYYLEAERQKGVTGETMLSLIERRLDNVIYRMGIGASRAESRQIVNHGHITVNGKAVNIPSFSVKKGDVIAVKENSRDLEIFKKLKDIKPVTPKWVEFDSENLVGKVVELPQRDDIEMPIQEHLIIELYSR